MSILTVRDIQGLSAFQNKVRIPSGHQLSFDGNLKVPVWTTGTRPVSPEIGLVGYNTTEEIVEIYDGTEWIAVGISSKLDGSSAEKAALSAFQLKADFPSLTNGLYWINLGNNIGPQQVYCIMDSAYSGGGWMVIYGTLSGGTSYDNRVTANVDNISNNPFLGNYSLSYAKRSGVRAICSQTQTLVARNSTGWMRIPRYLWDSTTHSSGNFDFRHNNISILTSDGTTTSSNVSVGMINYQNGAGGDFGIAFDGLDNHSSSYWYLNSSCVRHYLYQYGAGYKVNTTLSGWSVATNSCASNNTNDINFLIAMR